MNNDAFDFNGDGSMLLPYELLYLLQWLVDHEAESIQKLIEKALKSGYKQSALTPHDFVELQVSDTNIHQSIVEFLGMIDSMLLNLNHEQSIQQTLDRMNIPALKQIDSRICDDEVVQASLEKTSTRIKQHPHENVKEILFKEILKQWKPAKKAGIN